MDLNQWKAGECKSRDKSLNNLKNPKIKPSPSIRKQMPLKIADTLIYRYLLKNILKFNEIFEILPSMTKAWILFWNEHFIRELLQEKLLVRFNFICVKNSWGK